MDTKEAQTKMKELLERLLDGETITVESRENRLGESIPIVTIRFFHGDWLMGEYDCGCHGKCNCMEFKRTEFLIDDHETTRGHALECLWNLLTDLDNGPDFFETREQLKETRWLTDVVNGVEPLPLPSLVDADTAQAVA